MVATGALLAGLVLLVVILSSTGTPSLPAPITVAPPGPTVRLAPTAEDPTASGRRTVSPAWVARVAVETGIPAPAVRAYGAAALRESRADPDCHLGWTTLAGLGWVESQQGEIGGRVLGEDGRSDRPVFGPALDGKRHTAAIRSADGTWERAVGPLQFLPSTWQEWSADGDGDGVADPQDLDDAALAAGRYLCTAGGDLATGSGWVTAVRAYNHADAYVRAVYDAASTYATRAAKD